MAAPKAYYPPLVKGSFTYSGHGIQDHVGRDRGGWYNGHATDLMSHALATVFAVEPLKVTSVTRRVSTGTGWNDGSTVMATGASGEEYVFMHLDPGWLPVSGQRLNAGSPFARLGANTAGGPHLHFAVKGQDPDAFVKAALSGTAPAPTSMSAADRDAAIRNARDVAAGKTASGPSIGDVAGVVSSIPDFIGAITDPHNILRGLQLVAGAVLVLSGVLLLARQVALANDLPDPLKSVPVPIPV